MRSLLYVAVICGLTVSAADAAIMTDTGMLTGRPIFIDGLGIGADTYDVTIQYNVNQSTTSGIGDLPTGDIGLAEAALVSLFTAGLIAPTTTPLVIQFVTATGDGDFDAGGAIRFLSPDWTVFGGGTGLGIHNANGNGFGVVSFESLSVPEPSSLALLAIASCGGIFVYRRNRKLVEAQS